MGPLANPSDVAAALLRPLTDTELAYVPTLIVQASQLLRQAAPTVDTRLAADPTDPSSLDPVVVASVVAGAVKRYMVNPNGIVSQSTDGNTVAYALRGDTTGRNGARGVLEITAADLRILFPTRRRAMVGSIRLVPAMAPRPVGRYGPLPSVPDAIDSVVEWHRNAVPIDADNPEFALPPDLVTE